MSFSVGIIGLPNAGKSTLFQALTKKKVDIAPHPFTTIHPNLGIVAVPDERLEKIAKIIKPEKVTPTTIEFVDIAGLVKGAHKGEGLGNQFLGYVRNCDAIVEVVRGFEAENIPHVEGNPDPLRDIEIIKVELLMKDFETVEGLLLKSEKDSQKDKRAQKKWEILKKIKEILGRGELISEALLSKEERSEIEDYQLVSFKPRVFVLNVNQKSSEHLGSPGINFFPLNIKMEEEISELNPQEFTELGISSSLDQLILKCYHILNLITCYTVVGLKETRAWTVKKGSEALEAAGKVHSDFEKKFIRAEVICWEKLVAASQKASLAQNGREAGTWANAKELGLLKSAGKEYVLEDGDIIEFKI